MRVVLKDGVLALAPEFEEERSGFAAWAKTHAGHVFLFAEGSERGGALHDLGPRAQACREPINILYEDAEAPWRAVSNLALTPFAMRGKSYASVEGFWQGLKFADEAERARVAALWGPEAKSASRGQGRREDFTYGDRRYFVGGYQHHALMREACQAKFSQNREAREALLATGDRPLTHRARRDSKTIPGALMADIWMSVRAALRRA